jgi:hypothetical protein
LYIKSICVVYIGIMDELIGYMFDIKQEIKEQYYIDIMNRLKDIGQTMPEKENKKHLVKYTMKTYICYIEDDDEYEDIKKDIYYESYELYQESEEGINEDYERVKEVNTDCHFYCYSKDIIDLEYYNPLQVLRMVGDAKKFTIDHYLNPNVLQDHQREVQDYYTSYIKQWDSWCRIVNDSSMSITDIKYIGEEEFME